MSPDCDRLFAVACIALGVSGMLQWPPGVIGGYIAMLVILVVSKHHQ